MLANAGPYFPPEYLHSLPISSAAENQKSPLELLAQTCSSIGKDTTPAKIALPPMDKSAEKIPKSPVDDKHRAEEKKESPKDSGKPGFRTVPPYTEMPPLVPINNHDESSNSSSESIHSPVQKQEPKEKMPVPERKESPVKPKSPVKEPQPEIRKTSSISPQHHVKPAPIPSPNGLHPHLSSSMSAAHSAYLNGLRSGSHPLLPGAPHLPYSAGLSLMGHGLSPEAAAYYQSQLLAAQSGLHAQGLAASSAAAAAAAQQSALKAGAAVASMNPYVSYTRVRTPSGATTLVPVCKDPYCTNCQLTVQTSHTSATCKTPGCSQCAHEKALLGLSSGAAGLGMPGNPLSLYPHLASLPSSASGLQSLSSLHSLYPHSALPSAHQGLPYICNWVAGHDYCGKRFNSSEELMQHLRSHTSSIDSGLPAGYGLGLPPSALSGAPGLGLGAAPISPNSLRRAYPTSLSPGLLSSSRFHPYKSPLGSVGAPPSGAHLPPLSAYYPQYSSLYGPRLGAAVP
ncbi:hypothetical protein LOTGIDRAFT_230146 [Lottia gigantea]|uniref:C2H2-type domain-containing protein n=1 Tax=Lottia gigantea TaxID=225164 RepID=V4BCE6_LOTGI|nr:hypothetical protein LOTGIDRAFT_230146 [Lottia gigantea]ESP03817.1 hypothetical protein LOTGIDRAFT_230146 [Lottia gigantea]